MTIGAGELIPRSNLCCKEWHLMQSLFLVACEVFFVFNFISEFLGEDMEAVRIAAGQTEQAVTPWLPASVMGCHRAPLLGFVHCLQTQGMDNSKITARGSYRWGSLSHLWYWRCPLC